MFVVAETKPFNSNRVARPLQSSDIGCPCVPNVSSRSETSACPACPSRAGPAATHRDSAVGPIDLAHRRSYLDPVGVGASYIDTAPVLARLDVDVRHVCCLFLLRFLFRSACCWVGVLCFLPPDPRSDPRRPRSDLLGLRSPPARQQGPTDRLGLPKRVLDLRITPPKLPRENHIGLVGSPT